PSRCRCTTCASRASPTPTTGSPTPRSPSWCYPSSTPCGWSDAIPGWATGSARLSPMSSPHPLDPASAEEYLAGRDIMVAAGLLAEPVRFAYYGLEEAAKDDVLAGPAPDRRLGA